MSAKFPRGGGYDHLADSLPACWDMVVAVPGSCSYFSLPLASFGKRIIAMHCVKTLFYANLQIYVNIR